MVLAYLNVELCIFFPGDVFDVTSSRHMYGPEGSYRCFAGREASRAMAKVTSLKRLLKTCLESSLFFLSCSYLLKRKSYRI